MLILDASLTIEIRATNDFKEYEMVFRNIVVPVNQPQPVGSTQGTHRTTPRAYRTPTLTIASPQGKKRKQNARDTSSPQKSLKVTIKQKHVIEGEKDVESYANKFVASMIHDDVDDSRDRIEPGSHNEHPKVVVDDDDNKEEKKYEKEGDEMGKLKDTVSLSPATTSKDPHKERRISNKYSHLLGALHRMCRCQKYMIRDIECKCVTTNEFWKVHGKVDQVLYEIVHQLAERATNDLIKENLKRVVADTVIQERDAFQAEVPALISKEFDAQAPQIIEELFKNYVQNNVIQVHPTTTTSTKTTLSANLQQQRYLMMQSNLQDQANDPALWDVLKRKFEKSSTSNTSCEDDEFHSQ
ncbi:hypothetical protein Tco_0652349 [Tanacetum coccineum]|uniref:Uncharacterized protein n=1 Tax=Tanacetum coccineum TaxID=301880 RepID=A0ABQ4WXY9_9ASTR